MRRAVLIVLVVAALLIPTGCSTCTAGCVDDVSDLSFTGELLDIEEAVATFEGPDGPVEIFVIDKIRFLDVGATYQVDAARAFGEPVDWETTIAATCGCEAGISHEDGGAIDTGWWTGVNRTYPVGAWLIILLGIPTVTLVAVTVNRLRRGADYDPFVELPDDGSWLEYDGIVDADDAQPFDDEYEDDELDDDDEDELGAE
jgi:hypothetical protein